MHRNSFVGIIFAGNAVVTIRVENDDITRMNSNGISKLWEAKVLSHCSIIYQKLSSQHIQLKNREKKSTSTWEGAAQSMLAARAAKNLHFPMVGQQPA